MISRRNTRLSRLAFNLILLFVCVAAQRVSTIGTNDQPVIHRRPIYRLLHAEGEACAENEFWISPFGVILELAFVLYCFAGIALVWYFYFLKSLEPISETLHLSEDVAGATFLAMGSSAPELFTSFVDTMIVQNNVGSGTIVGSAVINVLVIIGLTGQIAASDLLVDWRPILRDSIFYLLSMAMVIIVFSGHIVKWYHAFFMILLYVCYLVTLKYNEVLIAKFCPRRHEAIRPIDEEAPVGNVELAAKQKEERAAAAGQPKKGDDPFSSEVSGVRDNNSVFSSDSEDEDDLGNGHKNGATQELYWDTVNGCWAVSGVPAHEQSTKGNARIELQVLTTDGEHHEDNDLQIVTEDNPFHIPETWGARLFCVARLPYTFLFRYTIPDCSKPKFSKYYWATFGLSLLWMGFLSFLMVSAISTAGCAVGLDAQFMGLIVLAVGSSVPDCMAAVIAGKQGNGGMAVGNAIGSNVFDVLVGMGIPWMCYIVGTGRNVSVESDRLFQDVGLLFCTLAIAIGAIWYNNWKLTKKLGKFLLSVYGIFVLVQCIAILV